jgi:hypothetical protein
MVEHIGSTSVRALRPSQSSTSSQASKTPTTSPPTSPAWLPLAGSYGSGSPATAAYAPILPSSAPTGGRRYPPTCTVTGQAVLRSAGTCTPVTTRLNRPHRPLTRPKGRHRTIVLGSVPHHCTVSSTDRRLLIATSRAVSGTSERRKRALIAGRAMPQQQPRRPLRARSQSRSR